jgi:hypothetical protein
MSGLVLASVANGFEKFASYLSLEYVSYRLSQLYRLTFESGDTTLVEDTWRFDLIEILVKLQPGQEDDRLRLVASSVTFSDACYNYPWRGTIFSVAFGARAGKIRAEYVIWHPSATFQPHSALGVSIIRTQHRKNSDDRGQDA